jgi:hypothetical protein
VARRERERKWLATALLNVPGKVPGVSTTDLRRYRDDEIKHKATAWTYSADSIGRQLSK